MDKFMTLGLLAGIFLFRLLFFTRVFGTKKDSLKDFQDIGSFKTTKSQKNAVLIMASYRGGSTLAGEFFNRNPDVLYYFGEVYHKIGKKNKNSTQFNKFFQNHWLFLVKIKIFENKIF